MDTAISVDDPAANGWVVDREPFDLHPLAVTAFPSRTMHVLERGIRD
jgi:hypothetical protein